MKKVTWPTKEELRESTMVVIVVCLLISAFVYVVDMVVNQAMKGIL
ncbi:MAG TPA: preprotein translocase subunit SecE [Bacteroidota bacterium]